MARTPPELVQAHLNLDQQTMAALGKEKPIIVPSYFQKHLCYLTIKAKIVQAATNKIAMAITARVIIKWNIVLSSSNEIEALGMDVLRDDAQ